MRSGKRILVYCIYIFLGAVLCGLGMAEVVDPYWSGMGSALLAMGVLRLVNHYRICKDNAYREKLEIERTDERQRFLRNKAWAWAGYMFTLIIACCTIVLKVMGQDLLCTAAGLAVCLLVILYWGSYLVLQKKY